MPSLYLAWHWRLNLWNFYLSRNFLFYYRYNSQIHLEIDIDAAVFLLFCSCLHRFSFVKKMCAFLIDKTFISPCFSYKSIHFQHYKQKKVVNFCQGRIITEIHIESRSQKKQVSTFHHGIHGKRFLFTIHTYVRLIMDL